MSGGLLLLSHHTGSLFREDLLLKQAAMAKHGLATPLITHDLVADSRPPRSIVSVDSSGGLEEASHAGVKAWSLGRLKIETWGRNGFKASKTGQPSEFQKWFEGVLAQPAELLVAGGHHGSANKSPTFWGNEFAGHRPQAGFTAELSSGKPMLSVVAYRKVDGDTAVRMPFDASRAVSTCRLVLVLGCSGVDLGKEWQSWVAAGHSLKKKPLVLGWYGTHEMPKEADRNFSPQFWKLVAAAAAAAGCSTLSDLVEKDAASVAKAWGAALKTTYKGDPRRSHLWYWLDKKRHPEGAGAVLPDGSTWKATSVDGEIGPT